MSRFKEAREKAGLSQKQAASMLDVSIQAVSYWENGSRSPSIDKILQMCDMYNVSADFLLGRNPVKVTIVEGPPPEETPKGFKRLVVDAQPLSGDVEIVSKPMTTEQKIAAMIDAELKKRGL